MGFPTFFLIRASSFSASPCQARLTGLPGGDPPFTADANGRATSRLRMIEVVMAAILNDFMFIV